MPAERVRGTGFQPVSGGQHGLEARATQERDLATRVASLLITALIAICSGLPLAWIAWQLISRPAVWSEFRITAFRADLLARTLGYNAAAAIIATVLALPAALVIGRGRGVLSRLLLVALPVSLFMPSIVYSYGWSQALRLAGITPQFQSAGDVLRCVWSLAAWLSPLPAFLIGLSLRQVDANLQQQALLDGAPWRILLRQLAGPIVASVLLCGVLAVQEFAVYEPTGISVVATEVRMVFDTGAISSNVNNSMLAPISGGGATESIEQPARAAAAVATAVPMLVLIAACAFAAAALTRKVSASDAIDAGAFPKVLEASLSAKAQAAVILCLTAGVPLVSLVASMKIAIHPVEIWRTFSPAVVGSLVVGAIAGLLALLLAAAATTARSTAAVIATSATFLVGGAIVAIALIRLYNRPWLSAIYDSAAIAVMAYIARFGWIALLAGRSTLGPRWRDLRQMAATDGASAGQIARHIVLPIAWPLLLAAAVAVMTLAITEVPATVLLVPQKPQMLTPAMMTWLHTLRSDEMIEASLLLVTIVSALAGSVVGLVWLASRRLLRPAAMLLLPLLLIGCGDSTQPDEIWLSTGVGPGRVVYPRGIAYDKVSDTFYVVDRAAFIQRLDRDGKSMVEWALPDKLIGKPVGLSVGPDGNLYVPDTHYQRILVYDPAGKEVRRWGSPGTGPGQFVYPTDIAFDDKGRVFVSEYGDHDRIQVFDGAGKFLYDFGAFGEGPGEFRRPQSMVIVGETLYVTDGCNHRIMVFKTDGTFVRSFGSTGDALGQFRFPYGLDMNDKGQLIVSEFGNNRVQLVDPATGQGLKVWGRGGREPGEFAYPWGVVIDKRGRVVTVDAGNNRLQVFKF